MMWPECIDVLYRDLVIPKYLNVFTDFPQVLHEVVGERIVIIEHH